MVKALDGALGGGPVDLERRLEVPGGTCRTYRLRGRFRREGGRVLFDAMVADVTERRRAELGRERAEQHYHAVVESLSEGLIVLGLDGRILSANASAQRILGRSEAEMLAPSADKHWSFVDVAGNPVARFGEPGYLTLRDGEPRTGTTWASASQDGELRWLEENTRPLRSPEGELEGVVLTIADVTERFEADRRVRAERDFTAPGARHHRRRRARDRRAA